MSEKDGGYSGSPTEFGKDFLHGKLPYGKWQDHIEAWLGQPNVKKRLSSPILVVHYEDMKNDLRREAHRIAQFLLSDKDDDGEDNDNGRVIVTDELLSHCKFEAMKQERWRYSPLTVSWKVDAKTGQQYNEFVRTGRVGDGKEFVRKHFTDEMRDCWSKDVALAKKRWCTAGIDQDIVQKYLNEYE